MTAVPGAVCGPKAAKNGQFRLDERAVSAHGGTMNGFLAICSICEIIS
jgi:hypothetical protein